MVSASSVSVDGEREARARSQNPFEGEDLSDIPAPGHLQQFDSLLENVEDLPLIDAVRRMDGTLYLSGSPPKSCTFRWAQVESDVRRHFSWVQSVANLSERVKQAHERMGSDRLCAIRIWTGKEVCYVVTSKLREPSRTLDTLNPVLPYLKLLLSALHLMPETCIYQGTLYRAESGKRSSWDDKCKEGETIHYYAPTSFTRDPGVLRQFKQCHSDRTITVISNGVGYDLCEFSEYAVEQEVLLEPIVDLLIKRAERFDEDHVQTKMGEILPGLHVLETTMQVAGTSLLSGSLVKNILRRCEEARPNLQTSQNANGPPKNYILLIGNPGAGKSTILNSLAKQVIFKSGMSMGSGLTYQLDKYNVDDTTVLLDTPGLDDSKKMKQAADAITLALKQQGNYKIFFVVREHQGRVQTADKATLSIVLDAAPITDYGVIINQANKSFLKLYNGRDSDGILGKDKFLTVLFEGCRCTTESVYVNPRVEELDGEDDVLWEMPHGLNHFVYSLKGMQIQREEVRQIKGEDYEALKKAQDKLIEELKADKHKMEEAIAKAKKEAEAKIEEHARKQQEMMQDLLNHLQKGHIPTPSPSTGQTFALGSHVKVKPDVQPRYRWGGVTPNSVGTVRTMIDCDGDLMVDFPEHSGWHCHSSELMRASSDASAPGKPVGPSKVIDGRFHPGVRELRGACAAVCCECQVPCGGDCMKGLCVTECRWTCCGARGRRSSWPGCRVHTTSTAGEASMGHDMVTGKCMRCAKCKACTGFGKGCVNYKQDQGQHVSDSDADFADSKPLERLEHLVKLIVKVHDGQRESARECGCGYGDAGCSRCGVCKICAPDVCCIPIATKEKGNEGRLQVGERVILTSNYRDVSDARGGPLSTGDVGTIIGDDTSEKPYQVRFNDKTWWYEAAAITRAPVAESSTKSGTAVTREIAKIGMRVKRGKDWKWGDQDGGPGQAGKIESMEAIGDPLWCRVRWDRGGRNVYRVGGGGRYDLAIL